MDLGTVGGLGFIVLVITVVGIKPPNIPMFIDVSSVAIVLGGTFGAIFVAYPMNMIKNLVTIMKNAVSPTLADNAAIIRTISEFAEQARREGILALEAKTEELEDEFLKKGIQLAVDGTEPELIKDILSTEINFIEERHKINQSMLDDVAGMGPGYGMIGTLVGLVLMLANMADPSAIGPAMAVALLTTLYGSLLANVIFTPFSIKLKYYSSQEILTKTLMLEGVMSLQSGDNPRIVRWKLAAFLDPVSRLKVEEDKDG